MPEAGRMSKQQPSGQFNLFEPHRVYQIDHHIEVATEPEARAIAGMLHGRFLISSIEPDPYHTGVGQPRWMVTASHRGIPNEMTVEVAQAAIRKALDTIAEETASRAGTTIAPRGRILGWDRHPWSPPSDDIMRRRDDDGDGGWLLIND